MTHAKNERIANNLRALADKIEKSPDEYSASIQAHGGGGVSQDFPLAYAYAHQRTLRLADGPDEVHRNSLAKLELAKHLLMPGEVEMPVTRGS